MVALEVMPPGSPMATQALRGFYASVGATFFGHELDDAEVTQTMRDNLSPDLEPPRGLLVVAHDGGSVLG